MQSLNNTKAGEGERGRGGEGEKSGNILKEREESTHPTTIHQYY